jgi:hypothetical protein
VTAEDWDAAAAQFLAEHADIELERITAKPLTGHERVIMADPERARTELAKAVDAAARYQMAGDPRFKPILCKHCGEPIVFKRHPLGWPTSWTHDGRVMCATKPADWTSEEEWPVAEPAVRHPELEME